jgi:hypothetical protein
VTSLFRRHATLSSEQLKLFEEQGFLLVSGLVSRQVVQRAYGRVLARVGHLEGGSHHEFIRDPSVLACFSRKLCSAAGELARARAALEPPPVAYAISVLPTATVWEWPAPHIDHAIERDAYKTFPPPYRVGCLLYLNDIPRQSGGTVVWPGSHHQLAALAAASPKQYEFLASLNRDIEKVPLREPLEITAAAGGVLFYHYLCAHAGSANVGSEPRLALNHKW